MQTEKRTFTGEGKVLAELSNGDIIECFTYLTATGNYASWFEPAPVEWMYGWTEVEFDIDENSIEPMYPDEFDTDAEYPAGIKIVKIINILSDVDWEVEEEEPEDAVV